MDLSIFFHAVRKSVFHGTLTRGQVDGMERIIAYRDENYPRLGDEQLAYVLATVAWETGYRMIPVKETGSDRYLRSKKYWPHIGVGLVQVTWESNWRRFGIKSIEDGLSWPTALHACFAGMTKGLFTGRKLDDYIGSGRRDYVGARRIINGTDRAHEIAKLAESFRSALIEADQQSPAPPPTPVPPTPQFREWLLQALREDEEVRAAVIAVVFPEDEASAEQFTEDEPFNPLDEPHEEYGFDETREQLDPVEWVGG